MTTAPYVAAGCVFIIGAAVVLGFALGNPTAIAIVNTFTALVQAVQALL